MTIPFYGGCACGAIRYECTAEPLHMFCCHIPPLCWCLRRHSNSHTVHRGTMPRRACPAARTRAVFVRTVVPGFWDQSIPRRPSLASVLRVWMTRARFVRNSISSLRTRSPGIKWTRHCRSLSSILLSTTRNKSPFRPPGPSHSCSRRNLGKWIAAHEQPHSVPSKG